MLAIKNLSPKATYVEKGYGQVEPNHLSAQVTGQIYAQLPTATAIELLENGQFVKYDYVNNEVNFTGKGEWMLVYNEVKVYRDGESDADFAMIKGNYSGQYHHIGEKSVAGYARDYSKIVSPAPINTVVPNYTTKPFKVADTVKPVDLKKGNMYPRVFKTNIGDIMTLNTIHDEAEGVLEVGAELIVGDDGYLMPVEGMASHTNAGTMKWEVVKVYTMPDGQRGVKIMRIA